MKIFSVTDPEFKPYGRVVTGLDTAKAEILAALANTPLPAATNYVAEDAALQELPAARRSVGASFRRHALPTGLVQRSQHLFELPGIPPRQRVQSGYRRFCAVACQAGGNRGRQAGHRQGQGVPRPGRHTGGKSTPRRCTTRPAMWTQPRASACWSPCPKVPIPQSPPSRMTAAMTRSCGPATSGCSPIPTAPRPRPGRMSDWWGKTYIFRSSLCGSI